MRARQQNNRCNDSGLGNVYIPTAAGPRLIESCTARCCPDDAACRPGVMDQTGGCWTRGGCRAAQLLRSGHQSRVRWSVCVSVMYGLTVRSRQDTSPITIICLVSWPSLALHTCLVSEMYERIDSLSVTLLVAYFIPTLRRRHYVLPCSSRFLSRAIRPSFALHQY